MSLIVEDGSIVAGADSYVSLSDARTLADRYGWDLPTDDTEAEQALRNGAGYVGLQEPAMCGSRVSAAQELAYPRRGVVLYGFDVASNTIPSQVIRAQVAAAVEYGMGTDVRASSDGRATSLERVEGAVTVQYFNNGSTGSTVEITAALDALAPLLCGSTNGYSFRVDRG
ncbi:head-tail adaptor [Klebsiella phage VLCpiS11a]|uniref:head-tail adaptor n=1 Tax=Klebsiella phage VLCpiS11a TaxID=2874884 RepID=UPI0022DCE420|nr:head-tail adaptor [Klebsiella phage VLCpiS11a]UVX30706.1 head-tail adaptor [Klebsiella phage VLCpiS11a]